VAEKKIPLLTEVYQVKSDQPTLLKQTASKQQDPTLGITPELIARLVGHIKPRLEVDIVNAVSESLHEKLKKELIHAMQDEVVIAQTMVESKTSDFIDKTKADLKTELPRMYQASADMVYASLTDRLSGLQLEANVKFDAAITEMKQAAIDAAKNQIQTFIESTQIESGAKVKREFVDEMTAFQQQATTQYQSQITDLMASTLQSMNNEAEQTLNTKVQIIQTDTLQSLHKEFSESIELLNRAKLALEAELAQAQEKTISAMQSTSQQTMAEVQTTSAKSLVEIHEASGKTLEVLQTTSKQTLLDLQTGATTVLNDAQTKMQSNYENLQMQIHKGLESAQTNLHNLLTDVQIKSNVAMESVLSKTDTNLQEAHAQFERVLETARADVNTNFPSLYAEVSTAFKNQFAEEMRAKSDLMQENFLSKLNGEIPVVEKVLQSNIQQMLAPEMARLESDLRKEFTTEIRGLLENVKFVLPK